MGESAAFSSRSETVATLTQPIFAGHSLKPFSRQRGTIKEWRPVFYP